MAPESRPELMLCTLIDEPFDDDGSWVYEPKLDGLRVLVRYDGRRVELISRNGKPQTAQFPDVAEALARALGRPAELDGEIVCLDADGRSSFRELQQRFHVQDARVVAERARRHPAYIYVFDILARDGRDLRPLPLLERKQCLRESVRRNARVRLTTFHRGGGRRRLAAACARHEEGLVAKRADSAYVPGRGGEWVKLKCLGRQELVIGGFTDPQRSRVGLGALLVGYYDGESLIYAGKVGTGFTRDTLLDLRRQLGKLETPRSPFAPGAEPRDTGVHWVRPKLVAEIAFAEWTQHGILRQPRFEGLREDKNAREVRKESSMTLEKYRKKRDFRKTPEPRARVPKKSSARPIFVVQEHHASRLHYDFRLEAGGVLKSWAVPKLPGIEPGVRRLAVEVEDHPLDYAKFKGRIPEGEYGAGEVFIWDGGTYEPEGDLLEGIERGKIEFVLHGAKLKGAFALVRMGSAERRDWLLIKKREALRLVKPARFTNLDKLMFPEAGITKGEVLRYYEEVAPLILPELKDRPMTLERLPDGLEGPRFWQKNTPRYYPESIARAELPSATGKPVEYALVNDLEALLYLVNQGALVFHPYLSRVGELDCPDYVLFDLDPGLASFKDVVKVAHTLREVLAERELEARVKTSGMSGLHVTCEWDRKGGFDAARAWALQVAKDVVLEHPELATVERSIARRGRRIYVDTIQNAVGHHVVAPYSLRATPQATVSTPLDWDEVNARLDPSKLNLRSVLRRLGKGVRRAA